MDAITRHSSEFPSLALGPPLTGGLVGSAAVASGDRYVRRESTEWRATVSLDHEKH